MVKENNVKKFCCEDISKIENYDKAIADTTQTWACHHRLELIATGGVCDVTKQDLIDWNLYYDRPADELIFLTKKEHSSLHSKGNQYMKGKQHSEETKKKQSESAKGRHWTEEQKKMLSEVTRHWKVKHWKLVDGKRVWY